MMTSRALAMSTGPGRYCLPRHNRDATQIRKNEGSKCRVDDVAGISARPYGARHGARRRPRRLAASSALEATRQGLPKECSYLSTQTHECQHHPETRDIISRVI